MDYDEIAGLTLPVSSTMESGKIRVDLRFGKIL